jgi:hypothetical protein
MHAEVVIGMPVMGLMTYGVWASERHFWFRVPLSCTVQVRAADEDTASRIVPEVLASLTATFSLADVRTRYDGAVIDIDFEIGNAELLRQKPQR